MTSGADCRKEITSSLNCSSAPEKPLYTLLASCAFAKIPVNLATGASCSLLSALVSMTGTITAECKRLACCSSKTDEQSFPLGWWRQVNPGPLLENLSQLQVGVLVATATKQCTCLCKTDNTVTQIGLFKIELSPSRTQLSSAFNVL